MGLLYITPLSGMRSSLVKSGYRVLFPLNKGTGNVSTGVCPNSDESPGSGASSHDNDKYLQLVSLSFPPQF